MKFFPDPAAALRDATGRSADVVVDVTAKAPAALAQAIDTKLLDFQAEQEGLDVDGLVGLADRLVGGN